MGNLFTHRSGIVLLLPCGSFA